MNGGVSKPGGAIGSY